MHTPHMSLVLEQPRKFLTAELARIDPLTHVVLQQIVRPPFRGSSEGLITAVRRAPERPFCSVRGLVLLQLAVCQELLAARLALEARILGDAVLVAPMTLQLVRLQKGLII